MKIAIDGRSLTNAPAGIANYFISSINEMILQKPNWTFYILANKNIHPEAEKRLIKNSNLKIIIEPFFILKNIGYLWYFVKIQTILIKIQPDYFWAPSTIIPPFMIVKPKIIITVHDLVFKEYSNTMRKINRFVTTNLTKYSISRADLIWSVSNYTKERLIHFYPSVRNINMLIGSSIDKSIYKKINISEANKQKLLNKFNIGDKFILFVGTVEPRKNIKFLLSLMPELVKYDFKLLVVGAKGWNNTDIQHILNSDNYPKNNVIFSGFISIEDLINLYNIAPIFVSTSLNEGFGLPQLEAMACGCPVVTSHNSAMIEVVDKAGITVEGFEINKWVDSIIYAYDNRLELSKKCLDRAKEYEWKYIIKNFFSELEKLK